MTVAHDTKNNVHRNDYLESQKREQQLDANMDF